MSTPRMNRTVAAVGGSAFAIAAGFFAFLTAKMLYRGVSGAELRSERTGWFVVWAVAFPLGAVVLGAIGGYLLTKAFRGFNES